ncbi:GNAT family N-acetyltransferase [Plesiomonas sp.]|uniref:GNAT family N-acetyltransferase n=1 Tax=Plesiomonas sp. TaxID=2486279 RepID=UPI003F359302
MKFREASLADIPAMSAIRLAVKENTLSDPSIITYQMYEEYLHQHGKAWVCEIGQKIIGFSYAASEDHSIWALFVHPNNEGIGAGKQLLWLATEWLFAQGAKTVTLSTTVNTRADRFYTAQGWVRGVMKDEDEVIYTRYKSVN